MELFWIIAIVAVVGYFGLKIIKNNKKKKKAEIDLKSNAENIGFELERMGYKLKYGDIDSVGSGHYKMVVLLYQNEINIGTLQFGTYGLTSTYSSAIGYSFSGKYSKESYKIESFNHIIHLDRSGILFESNVPCSEPPPEWMQICGQLLRSSGFIISYPEWMENCPNASRYVNVVFQ